MNASRKHPLPMPDSKLLAYARRVRHDLHRIPELGFLENRTAAYLCGELQRMKIPFKSGLAGGTGIVALISGKQSRHGVIALRAEMDGLPVSEATKAPYASEIPGRMHACGHDGHMAIALATARWLWQQRDALHGGVVVFFQPAEEGLNGGYEMCKALKQLGLNPHAVFGLHGWPELPVGTLATRPGVFLAAVDTIGITVYGKQTHGSQPRSGIDPIVCAAALHRQISEASAANAVGDALVFSIGCFHAGTAANVIPEIAELRGTLRTLSAAAREAKLSSVRADCAAIGRRYKCRVEMKIVSATPALVNDPLCTEILMDHGRHILGRRQTRLVENPYLWSEDFAYFLQQTRGCFFALGTRPAGRKTYPMLHSPHYDFPDAALEPGIRIMASLGMQTAEHFGDRT